ncbi:MAG: penicillin-binding protein 2 [Deltaproteobacteria bacterium]|nr:penicillin-binding protein 2 [Deltaproteobacteria bacterium]
MDFPQEGLSDFQDRFPYAFGTLALFFLILFFRVGYLQIVKGGYFRAFSLENTVKEIKVPATRGLILDRYYRTLTDNRPAFDVVVVPQYVSSPQKMMKGLLDLAGIPPEWSEARWKLAKQSPAFFPFVFKRDAAFQAVTRIRTYRVAEVAKEDPYDLRGVDAVAYPLRDYPHKELAGMTLGYVSEVSSEELARTEKGGVRNYRAGDFVGVSGLEKVWEQYLRGKDGYEQKIVDAVGREVNAEEVTSMLIKEMAEPGYNMVLTIDLDLQKVAEEKLGSRSGAVVAMNPQNGELLVFASRPSFDPNRLATNVSRETWTELMNDPRKPLLNRAYQSAYPPGSTYKIVMAIAALEEGVVKEDELVRCPGYLNFGNRAFHCWRAGGHGAMAIRDAIIQSCDVFFYTMGLRLGPDRIAKYARMLGLGEVTGIDLEGEKKGLIPTTQWKLANRKEAWGPSETLSIAIGQGYDLVTPLQNSLLAAQVGNGGKKIEPHMLHHFEAPGGRELLKPIGETNTVSLESLPIKPETLKLLHEALAGVVSDPRGTAHSLSLLGIPIAGKTGTSQVVSNDSKGLQGIATQDHAWFVSYAPVENPEIAVSVLVEHGGHGSSAAAPIAGAVIQKYFQTKKEREGVPVQ